VVTVWVRAVNFLAGVVRSGLAAIALTAAVSTGSAASCGSAAISWLALVLRPASQRVPRPRHGQRRSASRQLPATSPGPPPGRR
jgi:hypothetical protein